MDWTPQSPKHNITEAGWDRFDREQNKRQSPKFCFATYILYFHLFVHVLLHHCTYFHFTVNVERNKEWLKTSA